VSASPRHWRGRLGPFPAPRRPRGARPSPSALHARNVCCPTPAPPRLLNFPRPSLSLARLRAGNQPPTLCAGCTHNGFSLVPPTQPSWLLGPLLPAPATPRRHEPRASPCAQQGARRACTRSPSCGCLNPTCPRAWGRPARCAPVLGSTLEGPFFDCTASYLRSPGPGGRPCGGRTGRGPRPLRYHGATARPSVPAPWY
jgi:hypothetical protein